MALPVRRACRYTGATARRGYGVVESSLVQQGVELMLVGMGTVFVFLTLLVFATSAMSALVRRLQPAPSEPGVSAEEIAVIAAAVARYRGDVWSPNGQA